MGHLVGHLLGMRTLPLVLLQMVLLLLLEQAGGGLRVQALHLQVRVLRVLQMVVVLQVLLVLLQMLLLRVVVVVEVQRAVLVAWGAAARQGRLVSVGRRLLVLAALHGEEVLQLPLQRLEGGPLDGVLVPALEHDLVERGRATGRTRHAVAVVHLVQHLGVGHAGVGDPAVGDQLRKQDTKGPHVGLDGELAVVGCLGSRPLDGEACSHSCLVLVLLEQTTNQFSLHFTWND